MVHCMAINYTNHHQKCKGWDKTITFHRISKNIYMYLRKNGLLQSKFTHVKQI